VLALGRLTFSHLIPLPLILFVAATLIVAYVLKRRFIGRSMYIVGGNIEAANMMEDEGYKEITPFILEDEGKSGTYTWEYVRQHSI
ncbi:hypothetical protein KHX12_12500, partial [butyrate-producing bacterium]|nr:hypothetical protein [butyrate-producing bacterium]